MLICTLEKHLLLVCFTTCCIITTTALVLPVNDQHCPSFIFNVNHGEFCC